MKLTRRRKLLGFIAVVLILCIPAYVVFLEYLSANAETIGKAAKVQSGMTLAEVHSILGKPHTYGFDRSDGARVDTWFLVDGIVSVSYDAEVRVKTLETGEIDRWTMLKIRFQFW
jgi:hypothetical protein